MNLPVEKFVAKQPSKYDLLLEALNNLITEWRDDGQFEIQFAVAANELQSVIDKVVRNV